MYVFVCLLLSFCKQLLGVQKQTTNIGVLLELGQIPLSILAQKNSIRNWVRIVTKTKCNDNLLQSHENATFNGLTWATRIETTLSEIGLGEQFLTNDKNTDLEALQRMQDIFHQNAFTDNQRENSKLRTYSLLKTSPGYETYLSDLHTIEERTALTKFRLSNHLLMIEKGRHLKIEPTSRLCPFCPHEIEDELHFFMDCKLHSYIRDELFPKSQKFHTSKC